MPHATGSIADYDLVLSISAEAINRQFKVLYDTPINTIKDLPPPKPTKVEGAAQPPQTEHLINHRLDIHIDNKGKPNKHRGLRSFIECPWVEFDNLKTKVNDYRTAKISIKFKKEKDQESVFTEPEIDEDLNVKMVETVVTGWTMSWEVKLGQANISDIMGELIKPAKSGDSSAILHPETAKAFEGLDETNNAPLNDDTKNNSQTVDSRKFLVSSIFCVFQAAQLANTFELRDPNGKLLPMQEAPGLFMSNVSQYFTGMQVKPGQMTPENPFVLGYGISQELPDIKSLNSDVNLDLTPRYLVPKSFQLTLTPGTSNPDGSKFTAGTLNFCMLTHRNAWPGTQKEQPGRDTNGETNPSAGVLARTLFDTTRTSAHDGVMGFCKELIFDKYICENLGLRFLMDPTKFADGLYGTGVGLSSDRTVSEFETSDGTHPPTWSVRRTFSTNYKNDEDEFFMKNRRIAEGSCWVRLALTSDLLESPTSLTSLDAKRRTYIDVTYGAEINCKGKVGVIKMENSWSTQYWASLNMKYAARLIIEAGKAGVWSVSRDPDTNKYPSPEYEGGLLKVKTEAANGRYGAYATGAKGDKQGEGTGWWNLFGTEGGIFDRMRQLNLGISKPTADFENNIGACLGELKSTIIMPAGDAFLFTGVDCDEVGNVYSHVTYHQGARGATRT